jgi:DNA-binding SARP family transcriptional activator
LGSIYHARQDYKSAIPFRKQALSIAEESGVERVIAGMKANLGVSLALSGKLKEGIEYVRQCRQYDLRAGRIRDEIVCHLHIAEFSFDQGFLLQADSEYKRAIDRCRQFSRLREIIFELYGQYGKFLVVTGRYEEASQHLEFAVKAAEELNVPALCLQALLNKGFFYAAIKNKTGLDGLLKEIETDFKDTCEKETGFEVLKGFSAIFGKKIHDGIMKIEAAINKLERGQDLPGKFILLYFCAQMLKGARVVSAQGAIYLKRAIDLAEQCQMTGWLKILCPGSGRNADEPLRITCFGTLRVEHPVRGMIQDEQWQRIKPKQLLSILIAGQLTKMRYGREKIGTILWPDRSSPKMISNFHVCLYQLKQFIGKEHVKYAGGNYILDNVWIDACEFKQLVDEARMLLRDGKVHKAESKYQEAIFLYQGSFLEDMYDPWIDEVRKEMASLYRSSLFDLGDIYVKKFKFDQAAWAGRNLLKSDPFDEEGHRFLMRSYVACGEKAKAINQYKICAELFKKELNCLPSDETQELYKKIIG